MATRQSFKTFTMATLMEELQNTEILYNCIIKLNKAGNVTVQAPNSTTRYTIGSLVEDPTKFWIRGARYRRFGRETPYRLNYKRLPESQYPYAYSNYLFDNVDQAYMYFVEFWKKYKLNK